MGQQIIWSDEARADVRAIEKETALRILLALARYVETGAGDIKQLSGYDPIQFRLRVGDYRLRFRHAGTAESPALQVIRVLHRKEAYRD